MFAARPRSQPTTADPLSKKKADVRPTGASDDTTAYITSMPSLHVRVADLLKSEETFHLRHPGAVPLPLVWLDAPTSGLGDRFSAWLALFAFARLRHTTAVILNGTWMPRTHSHQASQSRDIQLALACLVLPPHVHHAVEEGWRPAWTPAQHGSAASDASQATPSGPSPGATMAAPSQQQSTGLPSSPPPSPELLYEPLYLQAAKSSYFKAGVVLPHPTPGFPQWAIPELAAAAFRKVTAHSLALRGRPLHRWEPELANLSLARYTQALRTVASQVGIRAECVPPGAAERFPPDATPRSARRGLRLALHLRRGDSWSREAADNTTSTVRSTLKFVKGLSDQSRNKLTNHTRRVVESVVRHLDDWWMAQRHTNQLAEGLSTASAALSSASSASASSSSAAASASSSSAAASASSSASSVASASSSSASSSSASSSASEPPPSWLIVSDDAAEADEYLALVERTSRTGQRGYVPPEGYALYSFLAMRGVDGIIQSSMRTWSSFSAVPSITAGVPILGVEPGKFGVLPHVHVCSTVEQYVPECPRPCLSGAIGDAHDFAVRVARGSPNCTDPRRWSRKEGRWIT